MDDTQLRKKPGHHKERADDFRHLSTGHLLNKYPNDHEIINALATKSEAEKFAEKNLSSKRDIKRFVKETIDKIAKSLESGTPIPTVKIKQEKEPDIEL